MSKETVFKPNYNKKKFTITIDVYENSSILSLGFHDGYKASYQEVIGQLESSKHSIMDDQRKRNAKEARKKKMLTNLKLNE